MSDRRTKAERHLDAVDDRVAKGEHVTPAELSDAMQAVTKEAKPIAFPPVLHGDRLRALATQWRQMARNAQAEGPIPGDEREHAGRWSMAEVLADELDALAAELVRSAAVPLPPDVDVQLLAWAVSNCHTLARRALARSTSAYDREKWEHVLRICEKAGARSAGVLRAALPTEMTEGATVTPDEWPHRLPHAARSAIMVASAMVPFCECGHPMWHHCDASQLDECRDYRPVPLPPDQGQLRALIENWRFTAMVAGQFSVDAGLAPPRDRYTAGGRADAIYKCANDLESLIAVREQVTCPYDQQQCEAPGCMDTASARFDPVCAQPVPLPREQEKP